MKKNTKAAIQNTLTNMTVVEMRKVAKEFGIKNAKQYRRPELFEKLFAAMMAKAEEELKAEAKTNKKSQKGMKKSPKGSNKNTESDVVKVEKFLASCNGETTREAIFNALMVYGRTVLIRVMKSYKVKGWYRIYDKPTMISKLISKTVDRIAA